MAKQEGLLKKFKLTTTISTSNMHLFDSKGVIKKYDNPEQSMYFSQLQYIRLFGNCMRVLLHIFFHIFPMAVLEEFFHVRLELYKKRQAS